MVQEPGTLSLVLFSLFSRSQLGSLATTNRVTIQRLQPKYLNLEIKTHPGQVFKFLKHANAIKTGLKVQVFRWFFFGLLNFDPIQMYQPKTRITT